MSTASIYSVPREARNILKRFRKSPPSLTVELYPNHFRFEHQSGIFLYDSPMSAFLDAVRAQQIPAQFLTTLSTVRPNGSPIPFYDGCLIVELVDYRASVAALEVNGGSAAALGNDADQDGEAPQPPPPPPAVRVILQPTPESNWVDLMMLSDEIGRGRWDDGDLLEVEARILASTAPPLHTGTSLYALRVANEACAATSPYASSSSSSTSRPPSSAARLRARRAHAALDDGSTFSLLRTGAPAAAYAAAHAGFRTATFARLQNIESFRTRVASDDSLRHPEPFKARLVAPPPRADNASPEKPAPEGGVYDSRPGSPVGKGKRRASNAAPGEDDDVKKQKVSTTKKKKKKAAAAEETPAAAAAAAATAEAESPDKAAGAKKKGGTKKKGGKKDAVPQDDESTAAPIPAPSEAEDTKPKKAPAKSKGKKAAAAAGTSTSGTPAAATPASAVDMSPVPTIAPPPSAADMVRRASIASSITASPVIPQAAALQQPSIAPPPIMIPRASPIALPQSFTNHVQKQQQQQQQQQQFALSLPNVGQQQQQQQQQAYLPNGLQVTPANVHAMQQSLQSMQASLAANAAAGAQPGQQISQNQQLVHLQQQLARQAALNQFGQQGAWNGGG